MDYRELLESSLVKDESIWIRQRYYEAA